MARDSFIMFGQRDELSPFGKPLPMIEGDSSDTEHYWWTELRGYDFDLAAGERPREGGDQPDPERSRPQLGDVKIQKKVDWGSADLFRKCCEAAEASTKRSDDTQGRGRIDKVTIEICRQSGVESEGRIPFLVVRYFNVYVISYSVDISDPDPMETIELKCERAEFEYTQTDPYTGGRMKGGTKKATGMVQHKQAVVAGGGGGSGPAPAPTVAMPVAVGAAVTSTAAAATGSNTSAPGAGGAVSTEAAVSANFPGLWQGTGFGILPD